MKWGLLGVLLAGLAVVPALAQEATQKKIQCWTDKAGQRMCGDRVPPEYAGQKRDVVKDGRVVESVKAAKTPEEMAAEQRKQQEAAEQQRRVDYDRALLETYRSNKDIIAMRDERLVLLDSRIEAAEKNTATTDKDLERLRARADALTKENKPVDERLAKQIKEFERTQKSNLRALKRYHEERAAIETKFNADLARYNELRPPPPPKPSAAPAATAAPAPTPAPAPAPAPAATPAPEKSGG
jgi:hypothetical protein